VALILNKTNMKKIIFTVAAIFAFGFANAQDKKEGSGMGFAKGDIFITGAFNVSGTNNKNNDVKTSSFEIAPQVNFFLTNNITLGAMISYRSDKAENATVDTQDDATLGIGLAGRYYFTPANQFSIFAELGAEYNTTEDKLANPSFKVNGFGVAFAPGLNYHLSNHFSIEAKWAVLGFASAKADVTGAENVTAFQFGADLRDLSIGLNYKF